MLCQTFPFMLQQFFIFHLHEEKYVPHTACTIYTVTIHRTNSSYPSHNISFKFMIYGGKKKTKKELKKCILVGVVWVFCLVLEMLQITHNEGC